MKDICRRYSQKFLWTIVPYPLTRSWHFIFSDETILFPFRVGPMSSFFCRISRIDHPNSPQIFRGFQAAVSMIVPKVWGSKNCWWIRQAKPLGRWHRICIYIDLLIPHDQSRKKQRKPLYLLKCLNPHSCYKPFLVVKDFVCGVTKPCWMKNAKAFSNLSIFVLRLWIVCWPKHSIKAKPGGDIIP